MYRLVVSLGRVQTALPNCYGCDHQGSYARACGLQDERGRGSENSLMMWMTRGRRAIQTPPEPWRAQCVATSQTFAPLAVDTVIASPRQV